jgi:hypothetical protein
VRSEGNMSLKNSVTPPGIDRGTFRLLAQRGKPMRKQILFSITSCMSIGFPNSERTLHRTSIVTQSKAFVKSVRRSCTAAHFPLATSD